LAASEIEKLEARFNENPDGRYFAPLADAYRKAGRLDEALEMVRAGLQKHPDYLSAHIVLGRCLLDKKDDPGALQAFEQVLALDAENIIALKSLADIAVRVDRVDDARRWLQRLLAVDPMNAEADEQLRKLGGPLEEAAVAEAPEEAPGEEPSFADLAFTEAPTQPVEAIPAPPLEEPSPLPVAEAPTEPVPAIAPGIEPVEFEPPKEEVAAAPAPDLMPFDDQLQWGAGERTSRAVSAADVEAAMHEKHETTSAAIEFLEPSTVEHPPAAAPSAGAARGVDWERGSSGPVEIDLDAVPPAEAEPPAPGAPEPVHAQAVAEPSPAGLPLIMPEDVTPPEELARPSPKLVQMVSPVPAEAEPAAGEPMLTETMGDLYLKQGFRSEAAEVYRRLLSQRPADEGLRAKLAALESPPVVAASVAGSESVGSWLRRLAGARLGAEPSLPPPPPPPSSAEPTPMEAAFTAPEPESEPQPPGEPARPASEAFSLDQIFGAEGGAAAPPATEPSPAAPPPPPGASFDEFFGSAPPQDKGPGPKPAEAPPKGDDDLSSFNAWLHGLKR
jgi:tetratricopeptide (TPR) repeat protein